MFLAGHIHRHADGALAARVDFLCGCVGSLLIEICDRDLGAFACKYDSDLLANAARGTGDDGSFVLQTHERAPFGRCGTPPSRQVVVNDLAKVEGQVRKDVKSGDDLLHGQLCERRQSVRE